MTLSVFPELPALAPVVPPDVNSSSFRCVEVLEHVSLLPCYVGRLSEGIIKHLNQKVFRFSDQFGGILLSYSRPLVLQQHGAILDEQPHVHFDLKYSAYVFKPQIGSILFGVVNNIGGDHIGCLVNNCFNASVVPHTKGGTNDWFPCHIDNGSTVWFRVTNLENIGGVVSIGGEYCDINSLDDLPEVPLAGLSEYEEDSIPSEIKSHLKKAKGADDASSSCAPDKIDIISPKGKKHKHPVESITTPKQENRQNKKRKRTDDVLSTDTIPKPKKTKTSDNTSNSSRKQKNKRSKKNTD